MLDTDTCILLRCRPAGFRPRLPIGDCGISVIVLGELPWGVSRSRRVAENQAALLDPLAPVQVLDLDAEAAQQYGRLRAHPQATGQPIRPNDLWIPAHALARAVPLITHNLSAFRRLPDLSVETWMTASSRRQPSCIPSLCSYQITPKTSLNTRCSASMLPNFSINGRIRSSGQLGRW